MRHPDLLARPVRVVLALQVGQKLEQPMREHQVNRLERLMRERDDAQDWDAAAQVEAGITLNTQGQAQNLLQAAMRNSTYDEAAEATRRWRRS